MAMTIGGAQQTSNTAGLTEHQQLTRQNHSTDKGIQNASDHYTIGMTPLMAIPVRGIRARISGVHPLGSSNHLSMKNWTTHNRYSILQGGTILRQNVH